MKLLLLMKMRLLLLLFLLRRPVRGLIGWLARPSRGRRTGVVGACSVWAVGVACGGGRGQLRWKPFSMVAARRRSLMMSSDEYSGSFR